MNITSIIYKNKTGVNLDFLTESGDIFNVENHFKDLDFTNYDLYEFGTYLGQSICGIFEYIEFYNINFNNFVGFDSLEGLPLENLDSNNNIHWTKGKFSFNEYIKKNQITVNEYKSWLIENNRLPNKYSDKFRLIKGFYENTLNESNLNNLKPALFINIDCDIYTSTIQVLEFIFKNKLYVSGKTIIRYDDWSNNNMEYLTGQSKAHLEITKKYNIDCELLLKHSYNKDPEATWWLIK
jgi:hypothetical protein